MEASAVGACVAPEVAEGQFGVVVENDFFLERAFDARAGAETYAVEFGGDIFQCDH